MNKSAVTTHILDTHLGLPAADVEVSLWYEDEGQWLKIAQGTTNSDGRILDWMGDQPRQAGQYRIEFQTADYFAQQGLTCLYPKVDIWFNILTPEQHYHIPLLISANGFSTYRGS